MKPMTKHYLKNAVLHPFHFIRAIKTSVLHESITFESNFKARIRALEFARENSFTRKEMKLLNTILSQPILFCTVVSKDGNELNSMLFITDYHNIRVTKPESKEVICNSYIPVGYVVRAKATEEFPGRVDGTPRVFENDEFRYFIGKVLCDRDVCSSTLLKGVAGKFLQIDDGLKSIRAFFEQPFFGMG
jgi:hypothetical protein